MIDPLILREDPDRVRRSQATRGESVELVDEAVAADAARRAAIGAFEVLRAEQNAFGKQVATAPKEEKAALVAQAQQLSADVKAAQQTVTDAEATFSAVVGRLGNVIIDGVPAGGEDDWALVREVGTPAVFDFELESIGGQGEAHDRLAGA